jgi:EF-P beta-lysylation protein EpmB
MVTMMTVSCDTWQQALSAGFRCLSELLDYLQLREQDVDCAPQACASFALKVPMAYAQRMKKGDAKDPLLAQVLPLAKELLEVPGYGAEPLQESRFNPLPGLLHKYHGRVLLTVSGACAVHCRYCFRRNFPYKENNPGRQGWLQAVDYIASDPSITEVIFSGGDPLSAPDRLLDHLMSALAAVTHIKTIRFHTRMPVVLPARICPSLLDLFYKTSTRLVMVIHANHANELDDEVDAALARLKKAGVVLLNQSVLLAGVNDDAGVLCDLSHRLFDGGVLPYYLHQLDPVAGAAHFSVDPMRSRAIYQAVQARLPGYLVPKLVWEQPGARNKQPVLI